jgi:hypothetical protein
MDRRLSLRFLSQLLLLTLRGPAFGMRWTKPGAMGACAVTSKDSALSGYLSTPFLSLLGQIVLQDRSLVALNPDFPLQPRHRFGQCTHLCLRIPGVRPMHSHFRLAPNA